MRSFLGVEEECAGVIYEEEGVELRLTRVEQLGVNEHIWFEVDLKARGGRKYLKLSKVH